MKKLLNVAQDISTKIFKKKKILFTTFTYFGHHELSSKVSYNNVGVSEIIIACPLSFAGYNGDFSLEAHRCKENEGAIDRWIHLLYRRQVTEKPLLRLWYNFIEEELWRRKRLLKQTSN